jgi:hypothetical protein
MIEKIIKLIRDWMPEKMKYFLFEKVVRFLVQPKYLHELSTFSQAGEDAVLRFLFLDYGLDLGKVSYLDIGARHPTCGSNTFLFYSCGSKGVCVDADKDSIPLIKELRPRDTVLNVGITDVPETSGALFVMEGGGSTINKKEAEERASLGKAKIIETQNIPLMDINSLIKQNFDKYPIFLSIDIEGLDLPVLKSLNFDIYPIPVICAETCVYSEKHIRPKDVTITEFMVSKGYEIYADTYINTIFVNKKWFHKML